MLTSLLTLGTPIISIAGAVALLGEPLTVVQTAGTLVTLVAVGLVLARAAARVAPPLESV
jgi:drug/metabolite transporter (DMT)-like permease